MYEDHTNIYEVANHHIRVISEGSCEDWSSDAEKLSFDHRKI